MTLKFDTIDISKKLPSCGEEMREIFPLQFDKFACCNQGAYGTAPKMVLKYKQDIIEAMEANPDQYFRNDYRSLYDKSLNAVAKFINAQPEDVAFVTNITTGLNTVLKGLELEPESEIFHTSHTYPAIKFTIDQVVTCYDADILSMDIPLPISSEAEIVENISKVCSVNRSIRVVVLDYISSCSAILWPVVKIAEALKKLELIVIVDGAHTPGQIRVDIKELEKAGVDFYCGNLHKWGFAPRSCAVLWVSKKYQDKIRPLVTSNLYHGSFQDQFSLQGTADISNYIAAEAAIDFHKSLKVFDRIEEYVEPMLCWAQEMIAEALGTEKLPVPKSMEAPCMKSIAMPDTLAIKTMQQGDALVQTVMKEHHVIVCFFVYNSRLWARVSGNIYNIKEDYVKLKDALVKTFRV